MQLIIDTAPGSHLTRWTEGLPVINLELFTHYGSTAHVHRSFASHKSPSVEICVLIERNGATAIHLHQSIGITTRTSQTR